MLLNKRIVLVRHGESAGNVDHSVYEQIPDYDVPLSKKGIRQSIKLGSTLNSCIPSGECVRVYCSPYTRTKDTWKYATQKFDTSTRRIKVHYDPRIREREWGGWKTAQGLDATHEELSNFWFRLPDGESYAHVYDRVHSFIQYVHLTRSRFVNNILMVAHGMSLRVILMILTGVPIENFNDMAYIDNCEVIILEADRRGTYKIVNNIKPKSEKKSII